MEISFKVDKVMAAGFRAEARVKTRNLYSRMEWVGAFGNVGTLIPFVVAYISIVKMPPLGFIVMFCVTALASGL